MDLRNSVLELISSHVDIAFDINQVKDDDTLEQLGVNSINFIRVIIELEMMFNIQFDVDCLGTEAFENVVAFVEYVKELVNK